MWVFMDFKVEAKEKKNKDSYSKNDSDVAYEFAKEAYKEFGTFLKTVVLFGSSAKNPNQHNSDPKKEGDIDILLIVDDVTIIVTPEIIETYKIVLQKLIAKISPKLHVTTLRYTSFWDFVRNADPVVVNILRDGMPILDSGIFEPLQILLSQGRIRPSQESIWTYFSRAPNALYSSKEMVLRATVGLYWAVIDSAHAALMKVGEIPPSPEHVAEMIDKKLTKEKHIDKKYSKIMDKFYLLYKDITHGKITEMKGYEYDKHYLDAKDFVEAMRKIIY